MKFIFILLFFTTTLLANNTCTDLPNNNPLLFESRIAFNNKGGMLDIGVCWWHSRFQRSMLYLAKFNPTKPIPTEKELKLIISKLRFMTSVVEIPGFKNIYQFTNHYKNEIQLELESWQVVDTISFKFFKGIFGSSKTSGKSYDERMEDLYNHVKNQKYLTWTLLQLPGFPAHSYLIHDMKKEKNGYYIRYIDSTRSTDTFIIQDGVKKPLYLGFESDLKKIEAARTKYCLSQNNSNSSSPSSLR